MTAPGEQGKDARAGGEIRDERRRRRAERRKKNTAERPPRAKASRGRMRKTKTVELTDRERDVSRRWPA